jgi:hypothetical protein
MLFDVYIKKIVKEWKPAVTNGIRKINIMQYIDGQALLAESEDDLQIMAHKLKFIVNKCKKNVYCQN